MVLLTAFERFLLPALSRQLNHYSAPFWTRQALFSSFFRFLACHAPGVLESLLFGTFLAHRNYFGIAMIIIASIIILLICYIKRDVLLKFIDSYEDSEDNLEV